MRTAISVVSITLTLLSAAGSVAAGAQKAKTTDVSWKWSASGKHNESDLAQCSSATGGEQLELRFYKHEFGNISVLLPEPRELKSHSKSLATEMAKNKVSVTLTFDDAAPVTETWAILQDPDSSEQLLTPREKQTKLYELVLKSKKLSISYPDKDGKPVTTIFDVSAMPEQVQAHNEKIHHWGLKDSLELGLSLAPIG
jgi:type II secretory pathway component GspD/PulD (secretin)